MIQFTIKGWHIWAKAGQDIAPATLPEEIREWLDASDISEYGVEWARLTNPETSKLHSPTSVLQTLILFYRDKDALLFKLRWYEYISTPESRAA